MNITSYNDRVGIEVSLINVHGTPDNGILRFPFITLKGINYKIVLIHLNQKELSDPNAIYHNSIACYRSEKDRSKIKNHDSITESISISTTTK